MDEQQTALVRRMNDSIGTALQKRVGSDPTEDIIKEAMDRIAHTLHRAGHVANLDVVKITTWESLSPEKRAKILRYRDWLMRDLLPHEGGDPHSAPWLTALRELRSEQVARWITRTRSSEDGEDQVWIERSPQDVVLVSYTAQPALPINSIFLEITLGSDETTQPHPSETD